MEWCDGLDLEDWEKEHEDEVIYLHGCCDDWVNEHYQPGDKCIALTEYSSDIKRTCLMHSLLLRDGKYIDVRGETDDFDDVLDGFDYGEFNYEVYDDLKAFNRRMRKLGVR